ncbi:unnamed protein product [Amoebophrya sp. A25]|nr:unnamed protein product [Amoebophrya sp. A25]|eukprot:GSA25T00026343001.1
MVNMKLPIKWGKKELEVDVADGLSVEDFKSLVYSMTNVPVDRMKFLGFAGGLLKESDNLIEKIKKLKPNAKIQLIGTAEGGEVHAPAEKTVFMEDLTAEERAKILKEKKVEVLPCGLKNLGNTCYMNSVVQVLKTCPEFRSALVPTSGGGASSSTSNGGQANDFAAMMGMGGGSATDAGFTNSLRVFLDSLDSTTDTVTPFQFVQTLRTRFPQFGATTGNPPSYQQQDAEECLREMFSVIANATQKDGTNAVDKYFGFKMKSKYKCLEVEDEVPDEREESYRFFVCHMGSTTEPVSHMHEGIKHSLKEHLEKSSPSLGRIAQYEKSTCMATLPQYLWVQFARFGYKQASALGGTEASAVKMVRKCAFSASLDVYDYATPELQKELGVGRLKLREKRELETEAEAKKIADFGKDESEIQPMEVEDPTVPKKDFNTGQYELCGVVSHKGRSLQGGHYVGWVKTHAADGKDYKDDQWLLFDDEDVLPYEWKQITGINLDLQGGRADTQIAYMCLYRRIPCVMPDTPPKEFDVPMPDAKKAKK